MDGRTVWTALALAGVLSAQHPAGDPRARIEAARTELESGQPDRALPTLFELEHALRGEGSTSDATEAVRELLAAHDPFDKERRRTLRTTSREFVKLARRYVRKKWPSVALDLIDEAQAIDPTAGARLRASIDDERPEHAGAWGADPDLPWPRRLGFYERVGDWRIRDDRVSSPPIEDARSAILTCREPTHSDHRIRVDVEMGTGDAMAGLLFGVESADRYYIFDVEQFAADKVWRLTVYFWSSEILRKVASTVTKIGPPKPDGLRTLELEVRGKVATASVDGLGKLRAPCIDELRGGIGFYVSGATARTEPIHFSNLRIEALPERQPDPDEAAEARAARLEQEIAAAIDEAEQLAAGDRAESAVRRLFDARRTATTIEDAEHRERARTEIDERLDELDPLSPKRLALRADSAGSLAELARDYREAGLPRSADWLLGAARRIEPTSVGPR